ncbi:MAG: FAD-dependent monooxygenase [Aureliella sp.]
MKVIIIGSGIAGLSAAIALIKAGVEVAVYERAPRLTEVGAGISLWANAFRSLDKLGVGASIREASEAARLCEIRSQQGYRIMSSLPASKLEHDLSHQPVVGMIHRAKLVELLAKALPNGTARYGYEATTFREDDGQVGVTFSNGQRDRADWIIGADGINSRARTYVSGPTPPRYTGYTCFRGVTALPSTITPGYFAEWWGRGCRAGIATLSNRQVYWWATVNSAPSQNVDDKQSWLGNKFAQWAEPVPELIATTPEEAILQNDILDRPPDRHWYRGRCLLIGDAAHPTTPNLGQGGCMAIEDAAYLLHLVSQATPWQELFPRFVQLRYSRTKAINVESRRIGSIGQWHGRLACWLRDALAKPALKHFGAKQLLKYARDVNQSLVE